MTPARDDRVAVEKWPPPYRAPKTPWPRVKEVSNLAPAAAWTAEAACAGQWSTFDPSPPEETRAELNVRVASAAKICAACPVLDRCREYARTASPPVTGILGGKYYSPNTSRAERSTTP